MSLAATPNRLHDPPVWALHRSGVAVDDSSNLATLATASANKAIPTNGYEEVAVMALFGGTMTGVTVEALTLSPDETTFVPFSPAQSFALTASAVVKILPAGRPIFVRCASFAGASPSLSLYVGGSKPLAT